MRAPIHTDPAARAVAPARVMLLAALAAVMVGWLGPLAYPFRLLTTLVHELGHGLAALLTGGAFLRFVVFPDGSGVAYTSGGLRWLIVPAGYLGAALFGAGLIALGRSPRRSQIALGALGIALILLSLRYAGPTLLSAQALGGLLTIAAGAGLGTLLLLAALRAGPAVALFLINLLAFRVGLSALGDLGALIGAPAAGPVQSDAQAMAAMTLIPAPVWAILWALVAGLALGWALWRTWMRR